MNLKNRSRLVALVATFTMMLAVIAPAAYAQSGQDGYQGDAPSILDQTSGDPVAKSGTSPSTQKAATQRTASSDALPFTGLDLGIVAVAGGSLMLLGFGMRRLTGPSNTV